MTRQNSMGNNSKNVLTRIMVFVVYTLSDDALYFYEVSRNILNSIQVIEGTRFCDRQTDRQPRKKNICLHPFSGGNITR